MKPHSSIIFLNSFYYVIKIIIFVTMKKYTISYLHTAGHTNNLEYNTLDEFMEAMERIAFDRFVLRTSIVVGTITENQTITN